MEAEGRNSVGSVPKVEQAGDGGAVDAVLVPERHPRVAEQVEPGDRRRASEERFEAVAVEAVDGCRQHGLFVEHVLATPFLEQPGQLGRRKVARRGTDAHVVASARRPVDVEPARNLGQEHRSVVSARVGKQDLAQDRSNRRLAIVRGDVDDPALDRVDPRRRNPRHGAGIRNPEERRRLRRS